MLTIWSTNFTRKLHQQVCFWMKSTPFEHLASKHIRRFHELPTDCWSLLTKFVRNFSGRELPVSRKYPWCTNAKMCFASKRRGATCTVHSRSTQSTNGQGILSTWSYQASMTNSMHLNRRSVGVRFSVFYGFLRYPLDYFPQTDSNQSLKVDR